MPKGHKPNCQCCVCKAKRGETKGKGAPDTHKKDCSCVFCRGEAWNKGMKMSEEYCKKLSEAHKGQIPWNKSKEIKKCKYCNKEFRVTKNQKYFCSGKCYRKYQKDKSLTMLICEFCGKEFVVLKCYNNRKFCSVECYGKWVSKTNVRENHHNWKGGISSLKHRLREALNYKEWRREVLKKDNYKCQKCGQEGGNLEAHHIKPFASILKEFLDKYSDLDIEQDKETLIELSENYEPFWDITNGKTFCKKCHKKTNNYFYKGKEVKK